MDWNRIETKWHEIARRLQQGGAARPPSGTDKPQPGPDSAPPDIPAVPGPDETAARVSG